MSLSAREGAGLYLVRRARTITAPHQLRLVVTAFLALLVVDLGRISLTQAGSSDATPLTVVGAESLCYLALALVLWRPAGGLVLAGVALFTGLAVGGTGLEPIVLAIMGLLVGLRPSVRARQGFTLGTLTFAGISVLLQLDRAAFVAIWFFGAGLVGLVAGSAIRWLSRRRTKIDQRLAEAATEDARIRADERRVLARELHDVVTHHLANASLQLMSRADVTDLDVLRKTVRRVADSVSASQTELRLLVKVLRDDPATAAGANEVSELSERLSPTAAAAHWARRLIEAGFDPDIDIPAVADHLQLTVQNTLTRTIATGGQNVLDHAPARSTFTLSVHVSETQVVVRAANPAPPETTAVRLGWGLRELRERVDLTGGAFSAGTSRVPGEEHRQWVVTVSVPRD